MELQPTIILETVEAVIAAFGGNDQAAKLAGIESPSAVSNWVARKRIPAAHYLVFQAALEKRGAQAAAALFGIREPAI